jgi:hypothetical protein
MDLALAKLLQNYNPYALAGSEMEDATPFATDAEGVGLIQLLGAGCLIAVVLTHISEAFHWFPWMHWGPRIGLVITSISGALLLVSRYFRWGTCSMRLQSLVPKPSNTYC